METTSSECLFKAKIMFSGVIVRMLEGFPCILIPPQNQVLHPSIHLQGVPYYLPFHKVIYHGAGKGHVTSSRYLFIYKPHFDIKDKSMLETKRDKLHNGDFNFYK